MTDADVDRRARRRTALVAAGAVVAWPVTVPLAVVSLVGFRVVMGWWPFQRPWSGRRYEARRRIQRLIDEERRK